MTLEKQFTDLLSWQMKDKVEMLERDVDHPAVKELRVYVDQLDGLFNSLLLDQSVPKQRRRSKSETANAE